MRSGSRLSLRVRTRWDVTSSSTGARSPIVGVMPAGFSFFERDARFWVPLTFTQAQRLEDTRTTRLTYGWYQVGRLRTSADIAAAQAQVDALNAANTEAFPEIAPIWARHAVSYHRRAAARRARARRERHSLSALGRRRVRSVDRRDQSSRISRWLAPACVRASSRPGSRSARAGAGSRDC